MRIFYRNVRSKSLEEITTPKKGSWIHIDTHDKHKIEDYAKQLGLDASLMLDGIDLYESPRIEREGGATYIFIRYCEPSGHITSTQPLLIVESKDYLVTITRKHVPVIDDLIKRGELVTTQKLKLILNILANVNKGYRTYLNGVTKQIFATRSRLQKTIINNDDVLEFIDIEEDLNEFLAALQPYSILLHALVNGKFMKLHEEDEDLVEDLELSTNELISLSKSRLKTMQNIREAYTTIATNNLNKVFKRLTSITIFLMIPTIISSFYGANVRLPFSNDEHAFTTIVLSSLVLVLLTILLFRKKRWL